jgi:hypothetical protein
MAWSADPTVMAGATRSVSKFLPHVPGGALAWQGVDHGARRSSREHDQDSVLTSHSTRSRISHHLRLFYYYIDDILSPLCSRPGYFG